MAAGTSKIFRVDWKAGDKGKPSLQVQSEHWQVGDLGEPLFQFESEVHLVQNQKESMQMKSKSSLMNSLLLRWGQSSCSIQTFNWLHEAHSYYGRQYVLSESTDLNVNLIQKHPHRNI